MINMKYRSRKLVGANVNTPTLLWVYTLIKIRNVYFSYRKSGSCIPISFFQDIEWKKVELYGF